MTTLHEDDSRRSDQRGQRRARHERPHGGEKVPLGTRSLPKRRHPKGLGSRSRRQGLHPKSRSGAFQAAKITVQAAKTAFAATGIAIRAAKFAAEGAWRCDPGGKDGPRSGKDCSRSGLDCTRSGKDRDPNRSFLIKQRGKVPDSRKIHLVRQPLRDRHFVSFQRRCTAAALVGKMPGKSLADSPERVPFEGQEASSTLNGSHL